MKRFLTLMLALVLVIGSILTLASCNNADSGNDDENEETKATTTVATTTAATTAKTTVVPEGYKTYKLADFSFVYPEKYSVEKDEAMVLMQGDSGNNINVVIEDKHSLYDDMTVDSFNSEYKPVYEEMGMTISGVSVEDKTVDGVKVKVLSYKAEFLGVTMSQTQAMFTSGNNTYSLTITVVDGDKSLANNVLESLTFNS